MYPKGWINGVRYCALGAIDGWLFGTFAWLLNEAHLSGVLPTPNFIVIDGMIIDLADPIPPSYGEVSIICMLTFSIVSYGVHRIDVKGRHSLLLLWQIIGLISLTLILCLAQLGWQRYFFSPSKGWVILFGLVAVVISNFIIGVIVEAATKIYTRPSAGGDKGSNGAA